MTSRPSAALVSIGDELLAGAHPDLNAPVLARALQTLGIAVERVSILADREEEIAEVLQELGRRHALVISSGGLGPTEDDVTRHAFARAAGVELEHREDAWQHVVELFRRRDREPSDTNRRQALFPSGAELLWNRVGTAHGFALEHSVERGAAAGAPPSTLFAALPGPPRELEVVLGEELLPRIESRFGPATTGDQTFTLGNLSESHFAELCGDWMARGGRSAHSELRLGVSAREGLLVAKLRGSSDDPEFERRAAEFRERFAAWLLFEGSGGIEERVVAASIRQGRPLALAESCTGGLVAETLTRVPGSSAALLEAVVSYSNAAKTRRLGVAPELIERHGAVSSEVAAAMVTGAAAATDVDLAVSITGIAGPGGGSEEKPVGTVWFGLIDGSDRYVLHRAFPAGHRQRVRKFAANTALTLLLQALDGRLDSRSDLELAT